MQSTNDSPSDGDMGRPCCNTQDFPYVQSPTQDMTQPRRSFIDKVYVCTISHESIYRPFPRGKNCLYISTKCQITKAKHVWFPTFRLLLHYINEQFITILRAGQSEFDFRERLGLLGGTHQASYPKGIKSSFPACEADRPLASIWCRRWVCAFVV